MKGLEWLGFIVAGVLFVLAVLGTDARRSRLGWMGMAVICLALVVSNWPTQLQP